MTITRNDTGTLAIGKDFLIEAFIRHPGNADERRHALLIADAAIAKATK